MTVTTDILFDEATETGEGNKVYLVNLTQDTALLVDGDGHILGANAEGTLGIIFNGGHPGTYKDRSFEVERAIRIPRMLQSDNFLNYHVAEIAYYEGRQALRFPERIGVLGANNFFLLETDNVFTMIPESAEQRCFVGFYLSPLNKYKLCLVSENEIWPADFERQVRQKGEGVNLYQLLQKNCGSGDSQELRNLLFVPEVSAKKQETQDNGVMDLRTGDYLSLAENKGLSGWWFNLPIAVYPWMTTNLERLLTGLLEEDQSTIKTTGNERLRGWSLYHWLVLIKHLTLGLYEIHRIKAIHGDPRPANIMADTPDGRALTPESFRWIDVGLGYGAEAATGSGQIPRPLGGSRSSVFYAPERDEGNEYEDADIVSLKRKDDLFKLSFFWRERTNKEAQILYLKEDQKGIRALGNLSKGDRVQVREFVFDVERVEEDGIIVSKVFELFLDRVLIEKSGEGLEEVLGRLQQAPISRYKIFYEWSQATDIYSLGVMVLYFFYIRGLHKGLLKDEIHDYANRETLFKELVSVLKNRSFLDTFLRTLKGKEFASRQAILHPDVYELDSDKIDDIAGILYAADTNFIFVLQGLDNNYGLFLQVIYFCLSCVWRQKEIDEIVRKSDFAFSTFAYSRHFDNDNSEQAAENAKIFIEELIMIYGRTAHREEMINDSELDKFKGASRIDQVLSLMNELKKSNKELEKSQRELEQAKNKITRSTRTVRKALSLSKAANHRILSRFTGEMKQVQELLETIAT